MQSRIGRQFRRMSWLCAIVLLLGFIAKPSAPAFAQTGLLIPGIVNEASTLPTNSFGYQEFRDVTRQFDYTGGIVCVSSSETSCQSLQIDDGIKIWVNGTKLGNADDYLSRTQPVGPFYIQNQLNPGANSIRVVLYDVQGQYRGGSPVYLTTLPDGTWYGNCTTKPISVTPFQTEYELPAGTVVNAGQTLQRSIVYNYELQGSTCSQFGVSFDPDTDAEGYSGGHAWSLEGQIGGQPFELNVDPRGQVHTFGVSVPNNTTGTTGVAHVGNGINFLFEYGAETTTQIGNPANFGISISERQLLLNRYRSRSQPVVDYNAGYASSDILLKLRVVSAFALLAGYLVYLTASVAPPLAIGALLITAFALPQQKPPPQQPQQQSFATYHAMAMAKPESVVLASVSADVSTAVAQRMGATANYMTVSPISTRNRVSAYTVFDYDADGFTPYGAVLVTFGTPNGTRDVVRQLIPADANGHLHGTIEMPDPSQVAYGTYVLIASDYESAKDSVYAYIENPANTNLNMKAAAALVDVVPDVTPPVTTAYATGPLDTNKVFRDTVTVKLAATDDLSGVHHSEHSLNNGQSWASIPNNGTFTISGSGITAFLYRSVDKYGNVEAAKNSGPIVINKYVAFANGTGNSLSFDRNNGVTITGDIRGNGGAILTSNINLRHNGTMTTVGSVTSSGNIGTTVPAQTGPATPILSYPMVMYQQAATQVYNGDLTINSAATQLSGLYYVNGNINISAAKVVGKVTLVATGNIVDTSTSSSITNTDPNNGIVYYAGGNITISSAKNTNLGMAYAPNGTITLNRPAGGTWKGSFVANSVVFSRAGSFSVVYNPGFASGTYQLPLANPLW